jgi:hypothetical protein
MKKIIMLALVLTITAVTAFSRNADAINHKVLSTFSRTFAKAEDVRWELKKDLYKATFKVNGQTMFAYYNQSGEEVAITRNIHLSQLPLTLANALQEGYNQYWLTELFEVSSNGATAYYATVQSTTHITVLKAEPSEGWMVFKKDKIED